MCMLGSTTQVRKTNIKSNVCSFQKIKNDIYDNFDVKNGIVSVVFATEFSYWFAERITLNRLHIICLDATNLNNLILTSFAY